MRTLQLGHVLVDIFRDLEYRDDKGTLVAFPPGTDFANMLCSVISIMKAGSEIAGAGESEVRSVIVPPIDDAHGLADFQAHHFTKSDDPEFRLFAPRINLSEIIQEVILHPESTPEFRARVEALCSGKSLPMPTQSRRHRAPVF